MQSGFQPVVVMLAIDWGTSSLRIYLLEPDGEVRDVRSSGDGILSVKDGAFAATLERAAGDWLAGNDINMVMSGMIGSRQGWLETPYVPCPAGIDEIAGAMSMVQWLGEGNVPRRAWIVPGLSCADNAGVADVMRGEEVQILGISAQLDDGEHHVCLPGTHSKWARVTSHRIVSFSTYMTGEVFAVMKQHSILGRTVSADSFDQGAFVDGVIRAADPQGLLHHLFGARTRVLSGQINQTQSASYLSGVLIGHELCAAASGIERVHLVGDAALTALYARAASAIGKQTLIHDVNAAALGLFALAQNPGVQA